MLEKDIEGPVCKYAISKGWLAEKYTSPGRRSVPDRVMSPPHKPIFFIEFKAPGKVATEKQARDHERRRGMGHAVYVVDDLNRGNKIIDMVSLGVPHEIIATELEHMK